MKKDGTFSIKRSFKPGDPVMYNPITCPVPYLGQFENKYVSAEKELVTKMYPHYATSFS